MFGSGQVETDAFLRTLGWRQVAQAEYETKLSAETKKYLQAYADGVNAYLKGKSGKDLSVEHAALELTDDYQPEQWSPVDSVAWLKAMAWDLRGNMQDEIDRALMATKLSQAQIDELYPPYPFDRNKPIVEGGKVDGGKYTPQGVTGSGSGTGTGSGSGSGGGNTVGSQTSTVTGPIGGPANGLADNVTAQGATVGLRTQLTSSPTPWTRSPRSSAPTAAASARTPGSSPASTRRPASRCSRTTRTCPRSCPRSGTRWACTAARSRPSASTTWPATPSPACPAWSSATTPTSPGA